MIVFYIWPQQGTRGRGLSGFKLLSSSDSLAFSGLDRVDLHEVLRF